MPLPCSEARLLERGPRELSEVDEGARLLALHARVREEVDEEGVAEGHLLLGAEHAHVQEVVHLVGVGLRVALREALVHGPGDGALAPGLEDDGGGGGVVHLHGPAAAEDLAPRVVAVGCVARVVDAGDGARLELDHHHARVVDAAALELVEVCGDGGEDGGGHVAAVPREPEQLVQVVHREVVEQLAAALFQKLKGGQGVVPGRGVDQRHARELPRGDGVDHLGEVGVVGAVEAAEQGHVAGGGVLVHLDEVVRHRRHWLLAEDGLAVLRSHLAHRRVELRGRADHDRVHRWVLAGLCNVGGVRGAAVLVAKALGQVAHHVDHVHQARAPVAEDGAHVHLGDAPRAGDADADEALVLWRQVLDRQVGGRHGGELGDGLRGDGEDGLGGRVLGGSGGLLLVARVGDVGVGGGGGGADAEGKCRHGAVGDGHSKREGGDRAGSAGLEGRRALKVLGAGKTTLLN
eukprot:CAMPEP_0206037952 /NCGR_PEP_ID=MMETSP1466-20131121/3780_1 /ASSEMBLY_ACC=CAM_ASM_001126 /TAXON_ID=44452 /ORGANISM="Pavlova gyrans, Strain CCMP608" /LENGTH=462 /DNA_ID=CAMNT_0053412525 /DNA_START=520 /DNA_END=1905 /DNA_ORIENTATION=-